MKYMVTYIQKKMDKPILNYRISVIVPNLNGEKTIGLCLEALFNSDHDSFEVIVVDDHSADNSVSIIEQFPCALVRLNELGGAAAARNTGAQHSSGSLLFFTDADCLVQKETLSIAEKAARQRGRNVIIGGTYTCRPFDHNFFSLFQSVFIHFFELKNSSKPDYVAAHAMIISADTFRLSGGFPKDFLPIIEDVEYSHRLRRQGYSLIMEPTIEVQHFFNYNTLADSLRNGFRKSKYWTIYSLGNKDLFADSGTASFALKANIFLFSLIILLVAASPSVPAVATLYGALILLLVNIVINRRLFSLFYTSGGLFFMFKAALYYMLVYPLAVSSGALFGMATFLVASRPEHRQ